MKSSIIIFFVVISTIQFLSAQIGNDKNVIVKNNVKSSFEKHCFNNSSGSCTSILEEYDQKGNLIEWDMGRLGSRQKYIYDNNNNIIFNIWIDKLDSTKIDSFPLLYDNNNQLTLDDKTKFKNFYNNKGQLVKQEEECGDNKSYDRATRIITWNNFNKISSELTTSEIIKESNPIQYEMKNIFLKKYKYDINKNLIKINHYKNENLYNTFIYKYDSSNRLTEERELNPSKLDIINNRKIGDREDIKEFVTKISYNKDGSIRKKFTYFSDPCMGLDNHFLYMHSYQKNGLIDFADVYEGDKLIFSINYEYEYYKNKN